MRSIAGIELIPKYAGVLDTAVNTLSNLRTRLRESQRPHGAHASRALGLDFMVHLYAAKIFKASLALEFFF